MFFLLFLFPSSECTFLKQWPLAPNLRDLRITRTNLARWVTFFSKMAFGKCWRVWQIRANQVGESRRIWRVRAKLVGESRRVWQVLAKPLDECRRKQDRSFYAQITYFICIKRSILHSLNSPNLPNSRKSCQICRSRFWRVRAKWFGECWRVWWVQHFAEKGHFGEYSLLPKMANFWRVLELAKFAGEWPLLNFSSLLSSTH